MGKKYVAIRQRVEEDGMRTIIAVYGVDSVKEAETREREVHGERGWEYETRESDDTESYNGEVCGEVCSIDEFGDFYKTEIWKV